MAGSPIIVSLSTTDITKDVTWERKDGGVAHAADAYFTEPTVIPNPIVNIDSLFSKVAGVGSIRSNEFQSTGTKPDLTGGGVYSTKVEDPLANTQINQKNTIDITPLTADFMTKARSAGGVTMSLILSGKNENTPQYSEHKYIRSAVETDQFNSNEFYKNFAFITFHSRDAQQAVARSLTSNQFSLRKDYRYSFINIPHSSVAGMELASSVNGDNFIDLVNLDWGSVSGLSANALVTFQESRLPPNTNETISADLINPVGGSPTRTISCLNKTLRFIGFNNSRATFRNIHTSGVSSLFANGTYQHVGWIRFASPVYGSDTQTGYVVPPTQPPLRLRNQNAPSRGSRNFLELAVNTGNTTRLFGAGDNLGFQVGSYIQISGSSVPTNNGIYQVISIQDGIPGETNNVVSGAAGVQKFQYLELSREITPETGTSITIRNVSNLPIVHIKYEYTP